MNAMMSADFVVSRLINSFSRREIGEAGALLRAAVTGARVQMNG